NLANGLFGDNVAVNGDDLVYDNNGNEDKDGVDPSDGLHGDVSLGSDPFGLDHLINKKASSDPNSFSYKSEGFSVIEKLEETIKVGLALGLYMKGYHVDPWVLRQVWGNMHFDFASSSARGMSGGILCIWNDLVFKKTKISCNEYYVAIEGLWIPSKVRIKCVAVYAPQDLARKITLWESIINLL
nr:RNA-directed DNA polymerase, eukaryota [Tanacetum cinerariifolium]